MLYTHKAFDIAGRVLSKKVSSSATASDNPADSVTTVRVFNKAGLLPAKRLNLQAGILRLAIAIPTVGEG
jgi:hypothetical protein